MRKVSNSIIAIFFLIILVVPLFAINTQEGKISTAENRYLAIFPSLKDADGMISKTFLNDFQDWFNDNIGFRDNLMHINQWMNYKLLNRSPVSKVVIGQNDWYFFTEFSNLEIATEKYPLNDVDMQSILKQQTGVKNYLKKLGIDYLLLFTPSKPGVYPEYLPFDTTDADNIITPGEKLKNYLIDKGFMEVLSLRKSLLKKKKNGVQVFFATDTHWNDTGAYIAYESIMSDMVLRGLLKKKEINLLWNESEGYRDLTNMMGINNFTEPEKYMVSTIDYPKAESVIDATEYSELIEKIRSYGPSNIKLYHNASNSNPRILIYGDSMFENFQMVEMFAEQSSEVLFIKSYDMKKEIIDAYKPDIVIYEMIERSMSALPYQNQDFISFADEAIDEIDINNIEGFSENNIKAATEILSGLVKHEEDCIYSIDSINGVSISDFTVCPGDEIEIVGWMANSAVDKTYEKAYFIIEDSFFEMDRLERLDVGQYYNNSALNESGYIGRIVVPEIPIGEYNFRLCFIMNDGSYYEMIPNLIMSIESANPSEKLE